MLPVNVQLRPDTYPVTFPVQDSNDSLMLDSVVLVLRTVGSYGDTLQDLEIESIRDVENGYT